MDFKQQLTDMIQAAGIPKRGSYRPMEVCAILGISARQFWYMCEAWEPDPATGKPLKTASLDSFLLRRERRVRFDELVSYLERNHSYQRKYGPDPQQMSLFE